MEITNLIPHIEALIFASDKPLTALEVTDLVNNAFGFMEDKITLDQVETSLDGIREKYNSEFYPFELRQSGGGWQFLTKKEFHKTIAQLNGDKFLKRLSAAALETLAIVAYKQPVTKGEIEAIRGVSSDYAVQKLLEKELIVITGRNEKMPGHPLVYSTSKGFMDYFGINSAEDLPKIKEVLADQLIEPTVVKDAMDDAANQPLTGDDEPAPDDANAETPTEPAAETSPEVTTEAGQETSANDTGESIETNTLAEEPENATDAVNDNESEVAYSVTESGELVEKPEEE